MLKPRHHHPFTALAILSLFLTGLPGAAQAQSQGSSSPSVAEAARRAREQKKNAAKPVRTLTNEDLPAAPVAESNNANAQASPATSPDGAAPATSEASATPAVGDEESKRKKAANLAALERAKKDLVQVQSELDLLQRKFVLDSESYYSKPGYASDKDGKANLDSETQEINDKKQAVDKMKARVMELEVLVGEPVSPEPDKNPPPR